jgi:hypothetical protein
MLVGSADVATLARAAPRIETWQREPVTLRDVACLQLTAEMRRTAREAVLPAALHPTSPAALSLQIWQVGASPWGEFAWACSRVACRSGVRARGFTTAAFASTDAACAGLADSFGFPCRNATVHLERGYDRVAAQVAVDARVILSLTGLDPEPLGSDDVQYTGTMNLAHTPNGLRLVQVEAEHATTRVERLHGHILAFDATAWGNPLLDPYHVVSASVALGDVTLTPVRFVCRVDELAFTGTEAVAG